MKAKDIDYREAIQKSYASLGSKKQKIADYILENPMEAVSTSVQKMASLCGCEQTTIVRFAKQLGYSGLSELKIAIASQANMVWGDFSDLQKAPEMPHAHPVLAQLARLHCDSINQTLCQLDSTLLEELMSSLEKNTGVMTFGAGTSKLAAADLATKFSRLGVHCYHYEDVELSKTFLGYLKDKGFLFLFSNSGETQTVLTLAEIARREQIALVAVTSYPQSSLGKMADFLLVTDCRHEHPVRFGVMTSRIAQFAVVDAIALLYSMRNQEKSLEFISKGYRKNE